MKLIDLDPAWLTPDVFIFRSPTGHGDWLTCKRVVMSIQDQHKLIFEDSPYCDKYVVMSKPDCAWSFKGNDFNTLTVSPSIDASASGNWHGFIINGEIK